MIRSIPFIVLVASLTLTSALAVLAGWSSGAHVWILALGLAVGVALTLSQPRDWRRAFVGIFAVGLLARTLAHLTIYGWASASGGPFLSPDATLYFRDSLQLAANDFATGVPGYVYFGTFDCAHYYLFAAVRWLLDADLFALQTLNLVLSSVVGPLTFAVAKRVGVPHAGRVGLVVALYPTLIALSVNDMMKDAGIVGLSMIGIWALVEIWQGPPSALRRVTLLAVAVATLSYVRMSRFYVPAFLAAGILVSLALATARRQRDPSPLGAGAVVGLLLALALVEAIPMSFGWKSSPVMVWRAMNHSLATPEMRFYATGLVDRMEAGGAVGPRHSGDVTSGGPASVRASDVLASIKVNAPPPTLRADEPEIQAPASGANAGPVSPRQAAVRMAANGVRKLLGPYPWVLPSQWDARTILVGDFLMFPGVLVWYLLLPLALLGLVSVPWHALRQAHFSWPLLALTVFVGILFAQYMVLNLSYRQREFMFPLLALAAAFAWGHITRKTWLVAGYGVYVAGLLTLAVLHLSLRATV